MSDPFLGEIRMVGFSYAPPGWATCAGQVMAISQNSALFALLGTMYGGNGTVTFGLPDFRGRSPVGIGSGPGLSPINQGELSGLENVTLLQSQMPSHTHTPQLTASVAIPANTTNGDSKSPASTSVLATTNDSVAGAEVNLYNAAPGTTTLAPFNAPVAGQILPAGNNQPVPIRNPYLGINFIIATQGIFPSHP